MEFIAFDGPSVMIHSKVTKQNKQLLEAAAKRYGVPENTILNTFLTRGLTEGATMAKKKATKSSKKPMKKGC